MKRLTLGLVLLVAWWVLAALHRRTRASEAGLAPWLSLDLNGSDRAPDGTPPDHYAG